MSNIFKDTAELLLKTQAENRKPAPAEAERIRGTISDFDLDSHKEFLLSKGFAPTASIISALQEDRKQQQKDLSELKDRPFEYRLREAENQRKQSSALMLELIEKNKTLERERDEATQEAESYEGKYHTLCVYVLDYAASGNDVLRARMIRGAYDKWEQPTQDEKQEGK